MGNLIFGTTTIQGRTFDDVKIQKSKAGVPRPIVFGTARPIVGNIIATTEPRIETTTEEQGGKGGPSVEVENEEIFRTYAIRICEGPVTAVRRVWRNNELVWVNDPEEYAELTYGSLGSAAVQVVVDTLQGNKAEGFGAKVEFFLGGYDQMPSAVMESAFGIDQVHAYRGTCYMVVDDDNLTATGGAIPQYAFEVERCEGFALTSRPYPVESRDNMGSSFKFVSSPPVAIYNESMQSDFHNIDGILEDVFVTYDEYDPERINSSFSMLSGDLDSIFISYEGYDPESLDSDFYSIGGELVSSLITYDGYDTESIDSVLVDIAGSLT